MINNDESPGFDRQKALVRLGWVLVLVLLDLVTKSSAFAWYGDLEAAGQLVRDHDGHMRIPLFGTETFAFMRSWNPGAAFGQLGDIPHLLVAGRVVVVFAIGAWLVEMRGGIPKDRTVPLGHVLGLLIPHKGERRLWTSLLSVTLIMAGAVGNLYDNLILTDVSAHAVKHVCVLLLFGAVWCRGSTKLRWIVSGVLMSVALGLELTDAPSTYGSVRDFIDVYTPQWRDTLPWGSHFPTFNVADSCISVGAVLLLVTGFGDQEKDAAAEIDTAPSEG
ncbi:MAG: signal peptidase II [Planctomycetota bacterium]|nr:signal peptidase II [Planctomycetota bacterium]